MTRHPAYRWCTVLTAAGLLLLATAGPAAADTAAATAGAVRIAALGLPVVTSGTVTADNDDSGPDVDTSATPALSVLGAQNPIQAGVLVQRAVARTGGRSAACAGLVGAGGSVQIGADGTCAVDPGAGGVRISLGGLATIRADAITASCSATATSPPTGQARLVGAKVYLGSGVLPLLTLQSSPAANTGVVVPGVANLVLRGTTVGSPAGRLQVRALDIGLLSGALDTTLAAVTCGPNAVVPPTPAVPAAGLPAAAALLALAGYLSRRRVATALRHVRSCRS